jgi:hypothetical protein
VSAAPVPHAVAPPVVHEVLAGSGKRLDTRTRAFFEPRLGLDLGDVRVHDDARAARSADAVDALAYTVGRDVVFAAGRHAPHTGRGRALLAHELAHVAQQHAAPLAVRRQEPSGEGTAGETPGAVDVAGCDDAQANLVGAAVGEARTWVNDAAAKVAEFHTAAPETRSEVVETAIGDNFHTTDFSLIGLIAARFALLRSTLNGPVTSQCLSSFWCGADDLVYAGILPGGSDVQLCPRWFSWPASTEQVGVVIQEIARKYLGVTLLADPRNCGAYQSLTAAAAVGNAASYAAAARQIYHGGAFRPCPSLADVLVEPVPAMVLDYERAERKNKSYSQPNSLGWAGKLETVAGGEYKGWAELWTAGEYEEFAREVARYQWLQGMRDDDVDGILGLGTWSRLAGVGEAVAGIIAVSEKVENTCFLASEERIKRGYKLATGKEFELPEDASATTYQIILATIEGRMKDIPVRYRATGAAGVLVYTGLGEFVPEAEIWTGGLRPGAAIQVWGSRKAYDLLVTAEVEEDGKKRPINADDARRAGTSFYGTSLVFVRYDTENPERMLVRHFGDSEWKVRSSYDVWVAANVIAPAAAP